MIYNITLLLGLLFFLIGFVVTFLAVPAFIYIAKRYKIVDHPDGKLKKHLQVTPYLGGLSIFLSIMIYTMVSIGFFGLKLNISFVFSLFILLLLGLLDDKFRISPLIKLIGQSAASLFFLTLNPNLFFNNIILLIWSLAIINSINLIDIMDGLATVVSFWALVSVAVFIILTSGNISLLFMNITIAGALSAFFYYNRPTAKIYLGDAGSLFLGGLLAYSLILIDWNKYNNYSFFIPVIVMAIPILEVFFLIIIRLYNKKPVYYGTPDHFAIYLKNKKYSVYKILFLCSFVSFLLLVAGLSVFLNYVSFIEMIFLAILFITMWLNIVF